MKDYTTSLGILKFITLAVFFLITLYVAFSHKSWTRPSQGLRPLLLGILLILTATIGRGAELNSFHINEILNILTLHKSVNYSVGFSRLIALGYAVSIYGLEILFVILVKKMSMRYH